MLEIETQIKKTKKNPPIYIDQSVEVIDIFIKPLLQYSPIHPGVHPKHVPLMMSHLRFWQFSGHDSLHLFPYTSGLEQPYHRKKDKKIHDCIFIFQK